MSLERTESQRAASRANGAKSHGPTSVMGRRISSRNSLKHGLLADVLLLPDESRDSLIALSTNMYDVFRPGNELEDLYVQRMVDAEWHLVRIRDYESAALMVAISAQGPHPEIPIDNKIWTHPSARASAAFQNVHARGGTGSVIQTSKMRYLREFKEAQTQLFKLRENSAKWRVPANEPGQLDENESTPPPENTEPEPDPKHEQATDLLDVENNAHPANPSGEPAILEPAAASALPSPGVYRCESAAATNKVREAGSAHRARGRPAFTSRSLPNRRSQIAKFRNTG